LPATRTALLTGRVTTEAGPLLLGPSVTTLIGFAVGFCIRCSVADAVGAFAPCAAPGNHWRPCLDTAQASEPRQRRAGPADV
jgi:hypothetical protein